mmetsp:Transcript_4959/g.10873  ORF Transcript_4959/g.10873 Transcript_4959/m.10873 type:complete len:741 (+) Transcript_4959:18-2240(+)
MIGKNWNSRSGVTSPRTPLPRAIQGFLDSSRDHPLLDRAQPADAGALRAGASPGSVDSRPRPVVGDFTSPSAWPPSDGIVAGIQNGSEAVTPVVADMAPPSPAAVPSALRTNVTTSWRELALAAPVAHATARDPARRDRTAPVPVPVPVAVSSRGCAGTKHRGGYARVSTPGANDSATSQARSLTTTCLPRRVGAVGLPLGRRSGPRTTVPSSAGRVPVQSCSASSSTKVNGIDDPATADPGVRRIRSGSGAPPLAHGPARSASEQSPASAHREAAASAERSGYPTSAQPGSRVLALSRDDRPRGYARPEVRTAVFQRPAPVRPVARPVAQPVDTGFSEDSRKRASTARAEPSGELGTVRRQPQRQRDSLGGSRPAVKAVRKSSGADGVLMEYGDRFLPGYERQELLGQGGCAVVWAATAPDGGRVAVKQAAKGATGSHRSNVESVRREIDHGRTLFQPGGAPASSSESYPGVHHIARILDHLETKRDLWLVMDFGGTSLTKCAFEIKGEFHRGERIYRVSHLEYYRAMKEDWGALRRFLREGLSVLELLAAHNIVHSDLKPDNILIFTDARGVPSIRVIDFGSAFSFEEPERMGLGTPEYMPPEALLATSNRLGKAKHSVADLRDRSNPWSFDIWSLGAIWLELCVGAPLWLSYKCRVVEGDRPYFTTGLFAAAGRDGDKILGKQQEVLQALQAVVEEAPGIRLQETADGMNLLEGMLAWNPLDRFSPEEALTHPFLES